MITLESDTQEQQELEEAVKASGRTIVDPLATEEPAEEKEKPAEPGEPGDKIPAETGDKTVAEVAEPAEKDKPKEAPQGTEGEPKGSKGGYKSKIEKQTVVIDHLREELEMERGDKTALREKLAEAEARLAELKPAEPKKETDLVEPTEPEVPDLAELDYDQAKYAAAMKKYKEDRAVYKTQLREYQDKRTEQQVQRSLTAAEEARQKRVQETEAAQAAEVYDTRLREQRSEYDDFEELMAGPEIPVSNAMKQFIFESDNPGHLLHHLLSNPKEAKRISDLPSAVKQVSELTKLEDKVLAGRAKVQSGQKPDEEAEPKKPVAAAPPPEKPPTKEPTKRVPTPPDPIEPLGGKSSAGTGNRADLAKQFEAASERGDTREAQRLLNLLTQMDYEAKHPGRSKT